jgi:Uma2 family endonuclease
MVRQVAPAFDQERRVRMSYEEYLARPEDTRAEWVDGEAICLLPPTRVHEQVRMLFSRLLALYVELFDLGVVYGPMLEMRILGGRASRLPDVLFVGRARLEQVTAQRLDGPADLVLEVLSDDSVTRDRRDKREQYERAGVVDYWILDPRPRRRRGYFYRLGADGTFQTVLPDHEGKVHAASVPGYWIRPEWFWRDPLPTLLDLIEEVAPGVVLRTLAEGRPAPEE